MRVDTSPAARYYSMPPWRGQWQLAAAAHLPAAGPASRASERHASMTRVVCYGLGPIGLGIARLALRRSGLTIVGAIDIDPGKVDRDLGELVGQPRSGVIVSADTATTLASSKPEIVLHATSSALARITPQLHEIMASGASVISTCEELAYPWTTNPQLATDLDAAARRAGITI